MAKTLVEKLREDWDDPPGELCKRAADEIERLAIFVTAKGGCMESPTLRHHVTQITGPNHDECVYCQKFVVPWQQF